MHFRQSWRWGVESQNTMHFTPPHGWAEKVMQRKIWIEDQLQKAICNLMGSSSLCIPTFKLAVTSIASKIQAHPPSHPRTLHPCPQTAFTWTVKQNKAVIQVKCRLFFYSGGEFQHPSCLWTGSLCKCLQKQQEKDGTGPEENCQGLKRAEALHPKAALMFASTEWVWQPCPSGWREISINRAIRLTPMEMWSAPKFHTLNQGRAENHENKTHPGKSKTWKKISTRRKLAHAQGLLNNPQQNLRGDEALGAPPDRDINPPGYSFIPHSAGPHLNSLPGDVFLIFLLNNYSVKIFIWKTQINILDDECWHEYYSTRMTSKNSSCTCLWSCCFSVWHLVLPKWITDWKSIFRINGHIHWFSSAPPKNWFYCSVRE